MKLNLPIQGNSTGTGQEGTPPALCVVEAGFDRVKAWAVELSGSAVRIRSAVEVPHPLRFGSDPPGRIIPLARACAEALRNLRDDADWEDVFPMEAVLGLPLPYVRGVRSSVSRRRPEPTAPVRWGEIREILRGLIRLAAEAAPPGHKLLAPGPVTFALDGHAVTDPLKMKGLRLEARAVVWFLDAEAARAALSLAEQVECDVITVTATPVALGYLLPHNASCWAVELHRRGASLYLLEGGVPARWRWVTVEDGPGSLEEAFLDLAGEAPPTEVTAVGAASLMPGLRALVDSLFLSHPDVFPRPLSLAKPALRAPMSRPALRPRWKASDALGWGLTAWWLDALAYGFLGLES